MEINYVREREIQTKTVRRGGEKVRERGETQRAIQRQRD